jgi:DNA-directed RNA polymerase III subunit RPC2
MIPDIVMSPLGFPSRMTMGKLLEILIGKAVCMSGVLDDGLEDDCFDGSGSDTIEKMGNVLERHGFHASGKELFCDGVTGEMIEAHVMSGVVHYVKLHHMVSKKIHARATGPRHLLTHQPNEGRSNNGGLRFGPMEVDCTLAHSASEILRERMLTVSDEFTVFICSQCGFIADGNQVVGYFFCRFCRTGTHVRTVAMPYTSKLMLQELNASGVKVSLLLE